MSKFYNASKLIITLVEGMTTYLAPFSTTSLEEDDEAFVIGLTPLKSILRSVLFAFAQRKNLCFCQEVRMGFISRFPPKQN